MKLNPRSTCLYTVLLTLSAAFALPANAQIAPSLQFSDSSGDTLTISSTGAVTTGGSCTALTCTATAVSTGGGIISAVVVIGPFSFNATGTYSLLGNPAVYPDLDINIAGLVTTGAGTLTAQTTATGVPLGSPYSISVSPGPSSGIGSATYSSYADPANVAFNTSGSAQLIATENIAGGVLTGLAGPTAASGSLTDKIVLVATGAGGMYSVDYYMVPSPYVATACPGISASQGVAITPATITPTGGSGSYYFSVMGLPAGLTVTPNNSTTAAASLVISGTPSQSGKFQYTVTITDANDGTVTSLICSLSVQVPVSKPGLTISKTPAPADGTSVSGCAKGDVCVNPYELVTYTYVVTNTGGTTLTNIVVVDDNGTPKDTSDDYKVGTIASLAPGASATLTWTTYPTLTTTVVDSNHNQHTGGTLSIQSIPNSPAGCTPNVNCYLKIILDQDTGITDNCYGNPSTNSNGAETPCGGYGSSSGWGGGYGGWGSSPNTSFSNLSNNSSATFQLYDSLGDLALSFSVDYLSQQSSGGGWGGGWGGGYGGGSSNCANSNWSNFPAGWGSDGWCGGNGGFISGNQNYIVSSDTTITDDLNKCTTNGNQWTSNSPSPGSNSNWNYTSGYSVTVNPQCFNGKGFGGVWVPTVQNCQNKIGTQGICPTPTSSSLTNTVTATATGGTTATATATVYIVSSYTPGGPGQNYPGPPSNGGGPWGGQPIQCHTPSPSQCGGQVGKSYSICPVTTGGKGGYSYSVTSGRLPDGLKCDSKTGAITGTPTTHNQQCNFTITVSDSGHNTASANCQINIK